MRFAQISNLFFMQCDCGAMQLPHYVELKAKPFRSRAFALFNTSALRGAQGKAFSLTGMRPMESDKQKATFMQA